MTRAIFTFTVSLVIIMSQTFVAWSGEKFGLIMLAVTSVFLAGFFAFSSYGWRKALDGWGRSTLGWGAAQSWGIRQDQILRDVLKELLDYDEEAVEIHYGRSAQSSREYLKTFNDEDVAYITEGIREELR